MQDVAAVDAELICQRSRTGRRDGKTFVVFVGSDPPMAVDEIPAHVVRQRNRAAKTGQAEP